MTEQKFTIVFIVVYEAFSLLLDGLVDGGECDEFSWGCMRGVVLERRGASFLINKKKD